MSNILTSVLVSAGRHLIGELTESESSKKTDRASQLARFDERLDSVVNPDKTQFKSFLEDNDISSQPALETLQDQLQGTLLTDPSLANFADASGNLGSELTIDKSPAGYTLMNASGEVRNIEKGTVQEAIVDKLYRIESVLQLAAVHPTLDLDKAIDLSFEADEKKPMSRVTVTNR